MRLMRRYGKPHQAVWTSTKPPGIEYCVAAWEGEAWTLKGTLVRQFEEGPAGVSYSIRTGPGWRTKEVTVEELFRGSRQSLKIVARKGQWLVDGKEAPNLKGCSDVDLEASPVTNTLPIKRTRLKVGEKVEVRAAWVRFPTLKVLPLDQSYERTGRDRYVYRSSTGFESEIRVDGFGLVRKYGEYWVAA